MECSIRKWVLWIFISYIFRNINAIGFLFLTQHTELVKLFCTYGIPEIIHSDQGANFESTIIGQTLEAFGVKKSHTTPYHPEGDGMVERFNRTLLQLLRTYVEKKEEWEKYLPLALFAYRTAVHSSTGVTPFKLMYGREP